MVYLILVSILVLSLNGCYQSTFYDKDFIDVEYTLRLKINMTKSEVVSILGKPHYIEFISKENDIQEYKHFYNTKEKVFNFDTYMDSNGVIKKYKRIKNTSQFGEFDYDRDNSWGFTSESNKLIVYYIDNVLIKIQVN